MRKVQSLESFASGSIGWWGKWYTGHKMIPSDSSSLFCSGTYPPPRQVRSSLEQGMYFLSIAKEIEMVLVMQEQRCTFCQIVRDGTVLPPRIYHGLQTCYCKEIWGKTSRKGFVETGWKWRSMQRSCKHQLTCPAALVAALPSAVSPTVLKLVWAASLWVSLRTPCQHPHHAFITSILSLTQIQSAGNTTAFIIALGAPSRVWPWV